MRAVDWQFALTRWAQHVRLKNEDPEALAIGPVRVAVCIVRVVLFYRRILIEVCERAT
jgi:hypothetical protein